MRHQDPPIAGLTEPLYGADEQVLEESLARLRQWGLAAGGGARAGWKPAVPGGGLKLGLPAIDAHPLVREQFGQALQQEAPEAWRAVHGLLFDWFCAQPEQHRPDGIEALEPLYRAIGHGCRAGRYDEARREVYGDRIQRGGQGYTGYGRREAELYLLEARLKHHQSHPDEAREAREALDRAEARLCELGQWGLWAQLVQVAGELGRPASELPEAPRAD